jgi:hypothetical protein
VIRLLVRTGIALVAAAFGLIVADVVLKGVHISVGSFFSAVLIFAITYALMQPFMISQLRRGARGSAALGGVALFSTLIALIVTDLVSNGLRIHGVGDWLAATLLVWLSSLLAGFLLPYFGLKKYLEERRD